MLSTTMAQAFALLFILSTVFTFGQCFKLHKRMTENEIRQMFDSTPDSVPDYHVVSVAHNLNKRSNPDDQSAALKVLANGETVQLFLESTNDAILTGADTPVITAYTKPDGTVGYHHEQGIITDAIHRYESRTAGVVAYRKRSTDQFSFIGHIGDMYIRPVPSRLRRTSEQDLSNSDDSWSVTHDHILFARSKSASASLNEALNKEYDFPEESSLFDGSHRSQGKRSVQSIVYPSLVITTDFPDSDINPNTGLDEKKRRAALAERVLYLLAFWNSVDLRLRGLQDPKVRLRIAAIIIATDETATPYLKRNQDTHRIVVNTLFPDMVKYWTEHKSSAVPENLYHGIVTMTNWEFSDGGQGISTASGLCASAGSNVAIIRDNIAFQGILAATREIGHMLGAYYDNSAEETCRPKDARIMSPHEERYSEMNIRWSSCSLRNFTNFFRQPGKNCANEPTAKLDNGVIRLLPGKYLGANAQCRALGFDAACKDIAGRCKQLRCYDEVNGVAEPDNFSVPAEGTSCGPNKICLNAECVNDPQPNKFMWDARSGKAVDPWADEANNLVCPAE